MNTYPPMFINMGEDDVRIRYPRMPMPKKSRRQQRVLPKYGSSNINLDQEDIDYEGVKEILGFGKSRKSVRKSKKSVRKSSRKSKKSVRKSKKSSRKSSRKSKKSPKLLLSFGRKYKK